MTIPIVPGPFSFLDSIGKGIGGYIENKEKKRQNDFEELIKKYNVVYQGVKDGILPRATLSSKETTGLLSQIMEHPNMAPLTANASPQESLDNARAPMITDRAATLDQTGQQMFASTGVLPTSSQSRTEKIKAGALNTDLTPSQTAAVSGVPTAPSAEAAEQKTQDPAIEAIADRHVQELFTKTGKLPTSAEAFKYGFNDPSTTAFGGRVNETYYGQAIEKQRRVLNKEVTDRIAAQAKAEAAGDPTKYLAKLTAQISAMDKERDDLAQQLDAKNIVNLVTRAKNEGKTRQQLTAEIQEQINNLDSRTAILREQFGTSGGVEQPPEAKRASLQLKYDSAVRYLRQKNPKITQAEIEKQLKGARP